MKATIEITLEEVRELERHMVRRVLLKELGTTEPLLEDVVLARVITAGLYTAGQG